MALQCAGPLACGTLLGHDEDASPFSLSASHGTRACSCGRAGSRWPGAACAHTDRCQAHEHHLRGVPLSVPDVVSAALGVRSGRSYRLHGRATTGHAERTHGRAPARQQLRRVLFRRRHRCPEEGRVSGCRAGSDWVRTIVEADHPLQLHGHGAKHPRDPAESQHRQGDDRRPLDGRHAGRAFRDAVSLGHRTPGDLQPDWADRRSLRPSLWRRRRAVQAEPRVNVSDHSRCLDALRRTQSGCVEQHVRVVHAYSLRMDAWV